MFRLTERSTAEGLVLKLEGRCSAEIVGELDAAWRAATERAGGQRVLVDVCDLSGVDDRGCEQLMAMRRGGARFVARGCFMRELVREMCASMTRERRARRHSRTGR